MECILPRYMKFLLKNERKRGEIDLNSYFLGTGSTISSPRGQMTQGKAKEGDNMYADYVVHPTICIYVTGAGGGS